MIVYFEGDASPGVCKRCRAVGGEDNAVIHADADDDRHNRLPPSPLSVSLVAGFGKGRLQATSYIANTPPNTALAGKPLIAAREKTIRGTGGRGFEPRRSDHASNWLWNAAGPAPMRDHA